MTSTRSVRRSFLIFFPVALDQAFAFGVFQLGGDGGEWQAVSLYPFSLLLRP